MTPPQESRIREPVDEPGDDGDRKAFGQRGEEESGQIHPSGGFGMTHPVFETEEMS